MEGPLKYYPAFTNQGGEIEMWVPDGFPLASETSEGWLKGMNLREGLRTVAWNSKPSTPNSSSSGRKDIREGYFQ